MSIPSTVYKGHGTGNDFVVYADPEGVYEPTPDEIRFLDDRHFGIGGDGVLRLAHPKDVADLSDEQVGRFEDEGVEWFMDYRNADGTLAEMCGNGTRVTALFAQMMGYAEGPGGTPFRLGTRAGVKTLTSLGEVPGLGRHVFRVDMGAWRAGDLRAHQVRIPGTDGSAPGTFVDMGNPHVVCVIGDATGHNADDGSTLGTVAGLDLTRKPEVSPAIPSDQNVEFVSVDGMDDDRAHGRATMRVNERGVGETLSCGTGLCATAVTLRLMTGVPNWHVAIRGGVVDVAVDDATVHLTGDAAIVARVDLGDGPRAE